MGGYDHTSYTERALAFLEKDICYLARMYSGGYGMTHEDVAQDLRFHLWRKLDRYHPGKAGLRTWAQTVMRMRLIDIRRKKKEILDSEHREYYEDLGDKELAEEWELEEIVITTITQVVY